MIAQMVITMEIIEIEVQTVVLRWYWNRTMVSKAHHPLFFNSRFVQSRWRPPLSSTKLNKLEGDANLLSEHIEANVEGGEDLDGNEGAGQQGASVEEENRRDRVVKEDFRGEDAEDFQR